MQGALLYFLRSPQQPIVEWASSFLQKKFRQQKKKQRRPYQIRHHGPDERDEEVAYKHNKLKEAEIRQI